MRFSGLHILLTYQCIYECEHCFVWGSPRQSGTLSLEQVKQALNQAKEAGVESIYFEGGEPFLYYAVLAKGVKMAADMGFSVGIVSNAYWAVTVEDALENLQPFAGRINDLTVSSDLYHCDECLGEYPQNALVAAKWLDISTGMIQIAQPEQCSPELIGQLHDEGAVMYRGRASQMAERAPQHPWDQFTECPHENLRDPGRVHLDPLGYLHICQGISIGNLFTTVLRDIQDTYDADKHPIIGPLLRGGPAGLVREYKLEHKETYADACHLCYEMRSGLRERFPEILAPDQMYGVKE